MKLVSSPTESQVNYDSNNINNSNPVSKAGGNSSSRIDLDKRSNKDELSEFNPQI